jgi:hypothetical protein
VDAPKRDRLAEFFRRLTAAPRAADMHGAIQLPNSVLDGVEDEMTSIANDPTDPRYADRMKGVDLGRLRDVPGRPDLKRHRHTAHFTLLRTNGALEIRTVTDGVVLFAKAGADGRGTDDA